MITFLEKVKTKINNELNPEQILLIDNSYLHTKHKSFDSNKFHFKLIIKSEKLKNMVKIDAHKAIFSILNDEMKNKIHALEIEIKYFFLNMLYSQKFFNLATIDSKTIGLCCFSYFFYKN